MALQPLFIRGWKQLSAYASSDDKLAERYDSVVAEVNG